MTIEKYRYRTKENKIQVQKLQDGKWISRTLPSPETTFNWLCPGKVSEKNPENNEKIAEKFAQEKLNDPENEDTKPITDLDIHRELNKLMGDLL